MSELLELSWFADARSLLAVHRFVLLVGEPGTGKTTFALHAARQASGREPQVLAGSPETEQGHLFGRWTLAGDETHFCDGPLPAALKANTWLVIEEFSQIPLECRASLLTLRGQDRITNPLNGEVLPIPTGFRLVATSNAETMACRRNGGIARALFDDFLVLEVPELDAAQVRRLLGHHFPGAPAERVDRVLDLWESYRGLSGGGDNTSQVRLSFRAAAHLLALLEAGMNEHRAIEVALVNKYIIDPDLHTTAKLRNSIA